MLLVVLLAGAPQQRLIGRFLDQRMLKAVPSPAAAAPAGRATPLPPTGASPRCKVSSSHGRDRMEQLIGKLAPQRRPELRQPSSPVARRSSRAISESCSVAGIASGGSGTGRAHSGPSRSWSKPGFQHHLGQLLHKQRHPIGPGHHLLHDLRRERLAVRHLRRPSLPPGDVDKRAQRRAGCRCERPVQGGLKSGRKVNSSQDAGRGALVDQRG